MPKQKKIAVICAALAAVVLLAFFFWSTSEAQTISRQIRLGHKFLEDGSYTEAILAFEKVLTIEPKSIPARMGLAEVHVRTGDHAKAEARLNEVIAIDNTFVEAYLKMADVLVLQGRVEAAIKLLEEAATRLADPRIKTHLETVRPPAPSATTPPGQYDRRLALRLTPSVQGWPIYYTQDGSQPSLESARYYSPIRLEPGTTTIRTAHISPRGAVSHLGEYTYTITLKRFKVDAVMAIGAETFAIALTSGGEVLTWGSNFHGQLGDGTTESRADPVKILDNVKLIASTPFESDLDEGFAIKEDNTLWGWGRNSRGQLGDGTTSPRLSPVKVMEDVRYVFTTGTDIMGQGGSTYAIKTDNSLWAWGNNAQGQLGNGTTASSLVPIQVMTDVKSVTGTQSGSVYVIKQDSSLWTWGFNSHAQLGVGNNYYGLNRNILSPTRILGNVSSVAPGGYHAFAIQHDGTMWGWGYRIHTLGDNIASAVIQLSPKRIMTEVLQVAANYRMTTFVLKKDHTLWSVGSNFDGVLGNGTTRSSSVLTQVASEVASVTLLYNASYIVKLDGSLWACGSNRGGQLGDGTTEHRSTFVPILPQGIEAVVGHGGYIFVLKSDGTLWGMGSNQFYTLTDDRTSRYSSPVLVMGVKEN